MGQVADDILDGACCEQCQVYFTEEHGHPVLCEDCDARDRRPKHERPPLARYPEL